MVDVKSINRAACFTEAQKIVLRDMVDTIVATIPDTSTHEYVDFTPQAAPAWVEGRLWYDLTENALSYYNDEADVTVNLAEENLVRVRNASGALIQDGKVVYISGSTGEVPQITEAIATPSTEGILGVTTHAIEDNSFGYVTTFGIVRGVDLSAFSIGDTVYLSAVTPGEFSTSAPTHPDVIVEVGTVVKNTTNSGKLFVSVRYHQLDHVVEDLTPQLGGDLDTNSNNIVFKGLSSDGLKVESGPEKRFMWRDLEGQVRIRGVVTDPTWSQIGTTIFYGHKWSINDECWIDYHVPHDMVPGSDIYIHTHWLLDGSDATNTVKWEVSYTHALGFGQEAFNLASPTVVTFEAVSAGTYAHNITESAAITIPSLTEPDGIIKVRIRRITNGATDVSNGVFMNTADLHYLSTGIGTANKSPTFYNT